MQDLNSAIKELRSKKAGQDDLEFGLALILKEYYPNDYTDVWSEGSGSLWKGSGFRVWRKTPSGRLGKLIGGGDGYVFYNSKK